MNLRPYTSPEQAVWQCLAELCPQVQTSLLKSGRLQIVVELPGEDLLRLRQKLVERLGLEVVGRVMQK